MAFNCLFLLNNGQSIGLMNGTGAVSMNDATCSAAEVGIEPPDPSFIYTNCLLTLNDGSGLIILNSAPTDFLALNDTSCRTLQSFTGSSISGGRMIRGRWIPIKSDGSKGQFTRKRYDQINAEARAEYDAMVAEEERKRAEAARAKAERIAKYKADRAARIRAIKDKFK